MNERGTAADVTGARLAGGLLLFHIALNILIKERQPGGCTTGRACKGHARAMHLQGLARHGGDGGFLTLPCCSSASTGKLF